MEYLPKPDRVLAIRRPPVPNTSNSIFTTIQFIFRLFLYGDVPFLDSFSVPFHSTAMLQVSSSQLSVKKKSHTERKLDQEAGHISRSQDITPS